MTSSFSLFLSIIICNVFGEEDVCIWNVKNDGTNTIYTWVNGLYKYKQQLYNRPLYNNNNTGCGVSLKIPNGLYLYFKLKRWYIGDYPTDDPFTVEGLRGRCNSTDVTLSDPTECVGLWTIPFDPDSPIPDSNIFAQSSKCPNWNDDCAQINVQIEGNTLCSGMFDANTTFGEDNVYEKRNGDGSVQYWYFNYHSFAWVCSDSVNFDTCISVGDEVSFNGDYWKDIDVDSSITIGLQSGKTAVITCSQTATTTAAPTDGDSNGFRQTIGAFLVLVPFTVFFSF